MADAPERIETERLILRAFTPDDWRAVQEFAKNLATSDAAKYDHRWPTSDEGCKGAAAPRMTDHDISITYRRFKHSRWHKRSSIDGKTVDWRRACLPMKSASWSTSPSNSSKATSVRP